MRMTSLRTPHLSTFILSAVGAVLAGCGGTASGDDPGTEEGERIEDSIRNAPQTVREENEEGETQPTPQGPVSSNWCVTGPGSRFPSATAGLNTEMPVDYIAAYSWVNGGQQTDRVLTVTEEAGEPCTLAMDKMSCQQELDAALAGSGAELGSSGIVLTTESGPIVLIDKYDIIAYLGEIDTFNEAVYVLQANRVWPTCDQIKKTAAGYQLEFEEDNCAEVVTLLGTVAPDGSFSTTELGRKDSQGCAAAGRLTEGQMCFEDSSEPRDMVSYMKKVCYFETAAVGAFMRLADELNAHGAPEVIVEGAARAAAEEIEHAMATRAVCDQFGVVPLPVRAEGTARRSLFEIAKENAGEGCVRELYGAAVAHFQAKRAAAPQMRKLWAKIAREETGHAQWSLELHAWMKTQLSEAEWVEVEAVRTAAREQLLAAAVEEPSEELVREAGLPTGAEARELLEQIAPLLAA